MGAPFAEAMQAFVDTAVDGGDWRGPLTLAQHALGVRGVMIQGFETFAGQRSSVFEMSDGVPRESLEPYARDYIDRDIRVNLGFAAAAVAPVFDEMLGDVRDLDRTDIYAGLFRPFDIGRFVGIRLGEVELTPDSQRSLFLTVLRDNDAEMDAALNDQAVALAHVVRGSLRSAAAFSALRAESDAKSAALNHAPFGWILLGEGQRILHMNTAGAAIVECGDGLSCRQGRLVAEERAIQRDLERATSRIEQALTAPKIMALPREDKRPYGLMLAPVRYDVGAWLAGGVRVSAALFVIDQEQTGGPDRDVMWRTLFGLSPAETHVAALLAQGLSKEEIAVARGAALSTVQTQLKHIYVKLGVNSQTKAAALLFRSAPFAKP